MSFIHPIVVGHFDDDRVLHPGRPACSRLIDMALAARLLADVRPEVAREISLRDGFVYCVWLGSGHEDEVLAFAVSLASAAGCRVIELSNREVLYPPDEERAAKRRRGRPA